MYIYESHDSGCLYISYEYIPYDELYCEVCGDSDRLLCEISDLEDLEAFMEQYEDCYSKSDMQDIYETCITMFD